MIPQKRKCFFFCKNHSHIDILQRYHIFNHRVVKPALRKQVTLFIMAKKAVKKVSRDFAQGELVDNILAPTIINGAYDESTGSYPAFKGFDTRELFQASSLPDLSRSSPVREVTFVCFDFTEFECLETLHDPKSDVENSGRDFYAHVHTQSLALEKLISEVRKVLVHLSEVLGFFGQ